MPLKEKNKINFRSLNYSLLIFLVFACNTKNDKDLSPEEKTMLDSISRVEQKRKADSMKRNNPLLIMPPDSNYTGSYVDKYSSGITKFVGFYRQGKRHGQWLSFFPNGIAWSELHYDKGIRQGPNLVYYENGKLRYSGFYKNDLQDSVWVYFDTLGKINKKVIFSKDKLVRELDITKK